jgi:hypothetical protein
MKKPSKTTQSTAKPAARGKSAPLRWSAEKSAALRKPAEQASAGDCNCNCGK